MMKRICLAGYYGYDNLGDEAILYSLIEGIRSLKQNCEITVLSASPGETSRRYGVKAVGRYNILKILSLLRDCDLFMSGGGSLIQDVTSFKSPLYYLGLMRMADALADRTAFAFQGVGPLESNFLCSVAGSIIGAMDEISVRDEDSLKLLIDEIGLAERKVKKTVDPVFLLAPDISDVKEKGSHEGDCNHGRAKHFKLGISVRPWDDNSYLSETAAGLNMYIREKKSIEIKFIPLNYEKDIEAVKFLERSLETDKVEISGPFSHLREVEKEMDDLDLLLGVRLHSLIFATLRGVPCVGIEYDPKVRSFLSQINLTPAGTTENISRKNLCQNFKMVENNRKKITGRQLKYVRSCRNRLEEYLSELLAGKGSDGDERKGNV